jgi:diguanylate cyclase (GGDEF)-like protein
MKGFISKLGRYAALFGACFMLLLAVPVSAATTDLNACLRIAQKGETVTQIIAKQPKFDCDQHQNWLQPGNYWVRLAVPKSAQASRHGMIFRTASLWDDGLELWAVDTAGTMQHYRPYQDQDINPLRLGGTVVVPLDRGKQPVALIYAKVSNSAAMRGVMLQSQLATTDDALRYEMGLAVLYAAFAGLSIALFVYNIALWRGMREPFLLAYCGMLFATLLYAFFTSGAPHYFFAGMTGPDRLQYSIPLLTINAAAGMIFIRYFFANSNIPKWLVRTTYFHSAFAVVFALFYVAIAPAYVKLLDTIYVYNFIPLPFIFACYVAIGYQRRDPFLCYFLLAWAGPALSAVLRTLVGLDILPYHIMLENSSIVGLALEALISSLAIGYRVRLLAKARDRAETAEAQAMIMADTDVLTNLPNRRAFVRTLLTKPREWQLILIDVDHFKRVNDTLGHVDGDEVLIRLAAVINGYASPQSIVARLGGEEFAIATVAPVGSASVIDVQQLLHAIRTAPMPGGYRITASVGIAHRLINDEQDWKILYRAADMALYRAKSEGRDRHVDYSIERAAA